VFVTLLQVFNAELAGYSAAIVYSLTSETLIVMSGHDGKLQSLLLFNKVAQKTAPLVVVIVVAAVFSFSFTFISSAAVLAAASLRNRMS